MAFTSWLSAAIQPRRRTNRKVVRRTTRLWLEQMEDRVTPVTGFGGNGVGWTLNSNGASPTVIADVLTLTDGGGNEGRSAFFNTKLSTATFSAQFTYTATPGSPQGADGVTFVLQNAGSGAQALGASGGGLGYSGITPSVAVALNIYNAAGKGTKLGVNGSIGSPYQSTGSVLLDSGIPVNVNLVYDGTTLVESLTQGVNFFSTSYAINIPATVGANAYVGFTGATGGLASVQAISNFSYLAVSISALSPQSAVINGPSFTLSVNGSDFQTDSVVQWNGVPLATIYVGSTQLTAVVPVGNLGVPYGSANITVLNPTTVPGTSTPKLFYLNRDTPAATAPTVTNPTSTAVTSGSATLGGTVAADNGSIIQKRGFLYAPTTNNATLDLANVGVNGVIQVDDPAVGNGMAGTLVGNFTRSVTGLNANTSYSMVAYATNDIGTTYTPMTTFGSLSIASLNPTGVAINGPQFTLTINGSGFQSNSVVNWNGAPLATTYLSFTQIQAIVPSTNLAVPYGSANITVQNPTFSSGTSTAKALYLNRDTPAATAPTVTNPTSTSITATTATLGGTVAADNGAIIQKRGFLYAPTANNATLDLANIGVNGVIRVDDVTATTGSFTRGVSGLSPNTSYSLVAYATNDIGTAYTSPASFNTSPLTIWTGPRITFTKASNTNPSLAANQDRLTPNVWLTRGNNGGIYNARTESFSDFQSGPSPADTEWAFGTTANIGALSFNTWGGLIGGNAPSQYVGQDAVLHLISENIYIDIKFLSWQDGGGGGFSYSRSTPAPVVSNSPPTVAANTPSVSANEGGTLLNTGTFSDAQGNATVVLTANVGTVTKNDTLGTWNWSASAGDGPAGPSTVTITATDTQSAAATTTFTYAVNNVASTATLTVNDGITYGTAATGSLDSPFDPSTADTTAGFHYAISIDTDTTGTATYSNSGTSSSANFGILTAGAHTVYSRIIDKDDGFTPYSATLTVNKATSITTVVAAGGTYNGSPFPYTSVLATGAGGLNDTNPSNFTFLYSGSGSTVYSSAMAPTNSGTYTVTAIYNGDANHDGSTSSPSAFTIGPRLLAVSRSETPTSNFIDWLKPDGTVQWTVNVPTSYNAAPVNFGAPSVAVTTDRDNDGYADLFIGSQSGRTNLVGLVSGKTGDLLWSKNAYVSTFTGGVTVAAGDITGDGKSEVITGTASAATANVRAFEQGSGYSFAMIRDFYAYAASYTKGVNVAVADVNKDGVGDIITGTVAFSDNVRVFNAGNGMIADFFAFNRTGVIPGFAGGVTVAGGDVDGDGYADIITGTASQRSRVRVYSGANSAVGNVAGTLLQDFITSTSNMGVQVMAADFGDGKTTVGTLTLNPNSIVLNTYGYNTTLTPTSMLTKAYARPTGSPLQLRFG